MTMLKGLYFTDSHDMGRNPGARIDDYHKAIINKFLEIEQVAYANDVDFITHGGDWFHTPRVAYSLYNEHQRILRRIRKRGIKFYFVPGNHDLYGYSMDTINQTAVGSLANAGLITLLTDKRTHKIDMGTYTVVLHGKQYHAEIDDNPMIDYYVKKKGDYDFLFSHGMLLEKPFHPDVRHTLTTQVVTEADAVFNGHYHPGYDMHEVNDTLFVNPGSTGRDEGSKDSLQRIPQYAMIEVDDQGFSVDFHKFAVAQKGTDVFDTSVTKMKKQHTRDLDAFKQTINDALVFDSFDPKDILSNTKGIPHKIRNEAIDAVVAQEKLTQDSKLDGFIEKAKAIGIAWVELINFQSHKKTRVEFNEKGLNAITGPSDSGKSTIMRGLRWALYNEPKGADFIRHGASRTTVNVGFTDSSVITRSRTKSSSGEFIVRDPNGKETEYKGFGTNIPIEIPNTHQMPKVELSTGIERSLNFSNQLDGHFLLAESPAVRANTIGRLTGVHVVDAAIKEKAKEIRQLTVSTNATEKQIEELDVKLEQYEDLDDIEKRLNVLKGLVQTAENLSYDIEDLKDYRRILQEKTRDIKEINAELVAYAHVERGMLLVNQAEQLSREIEEMESSLDTFTKTARTLSSIKSEYKEYATLEQGEQLLEDAEKLYEEITTLKELDREYVKSEAKEELHTEDLEMYASLDKIDIDAMEKELAEIETLKALLQEYEDETYVCKEIDGSIEVVEQDIAKLQEDIQSIFKDMGNKCPTCNQEVSEHAVTEMLDHIA